MTDFTLELDVQIQPKIKEFFEKSGGINIWQSHDLGNPSKRTFTPLTQTEKPGWQFPEYVPLTDYTKIKWYTWLPLARFKRPKHKRPEFIWQNPSAKYVAWLESICKKNNIDYPTAVVNGNWVYDGFYDDGTQTNPALTFKEINGCEKVFEVAYKKYMEV